MPDRLSLGSYLVYDVDTGDVLAAKDPDGLHRPASVIRILLVMTALDELDPDRTVPVVIVAALVGIGVLLVGVRWFTRRRLTSDGESPRAHR